MIFNAINTGGKGYKIGKNQKLKGKDQRLTQKSKVKSQKTGFNQLKMQKMGKSMLISAIRRRIFYI